MSAIDNTTMKTFLIEFMTILGMIIKLQPYTFFLKYQMMFSHFLKVIPFNRNAFIMRKKAVPNHQQLKYHQPVLMTQ